MQLNATGNMKHVAKERCRPLFDQALESATDKQDFYLGVIVGCAEKVTLGACRAFMLKPNLADRSVVMWLMSSEPTSLYGLQCLLIDTDGIEFWFAKESDPLDDWLEDVVAEERNSPAWHRKRGRLLGIPDHLIDEEYHLR